MVGRHCATHLPSASALWRARVLGLTVATSHGAAVWGCIGRCLEVEAVSIQEGMDVALSSGSDWCEAAQWTGALSPSGRARLALLGVFDASPLSGEDDLALLY